MKSNKGQRYITKRNKCKSFVIIALACLFSFHVNAADDDILKIKPNLLWLSNDVNLPALDENEYDSFLSSGEIWYKKWGVSSQLIENDAGDIFAHPADSEYFNFDVKRRFGKADSSNFEFGFGWQELSIDSQLDVSGPRVSLAGNYKVFKSFQLYGASAYLPELNDSISDGTASAYEIEAGLLYTPGPFLSLKAGYRVFNLDFDEPIGDPLGSSSGFLLGSDWSW